MRSIYVGVLALLGSFSANASTWGCEVLLCMANPAGPMAAPACVPPISALWRHLARGGAWPSCPEASSANTTVTMRAAGQEWCPAHLLRPHVDVPNKFLCLAGSSIDVVVDGKTTFRTWIGIPDEREGLTSYVEELAK